MTRVVAVVAVAVCLSAVVTTQAAAPPGAGVERSEVFRDGDFVVYDAKANGASAPAVRNDGYATYGAVTMRESYVIRLVDSDGIERVRPNLESLAATMRTAVGQDVVVASGLVPSGTTSKPGRIDVRVSSRAPCSGLWLGCAAPTVEDGEIESAQVWINPRLFERSAAAIDNTVRHELGHAFGLAHYDNEWEGQVQTMHSTHFDAPDYRGGDRNGLRALAVHASPPSSADPAPPAPSPVPTAAPPRVDPTGTVDEIVSTGLGILVRGEASDPDSTEPIGVLITMDDRPFELLASRHDEATGRAHGFEVLWSVDPGPHRVCVMARNVGAGTDVPLGCRDIVVTRTNVGQLGLQTL